jgi:hypothetical protein
LSSGETVARPNRTKQFAKGPPLARDRSVRARQRYLRRQRKPPWRSIANKRRDTFTRSPAVWSVVSADRGQTPQQQGLGWRNAGQLRCRCRVGN